ncbi:cell division protein FtsL [Moraxella oculi]|uniref:Cell division protein FtsL n=1 Tax=Moraxella oculi TaxID=2940516 RepID=A0ABW8U703_9GAMM
MNDKLAHLISSDTLTSRFGMVACRVILFVLFIAIMHTGVKVVEQTQEHHEAYHQLQQLKKELVAMRIEEQQLLIEQQTFSATPQVARRAVSELGMFFPTGENRRIITPGISTTSKNKQVGE